MNNVLRAAESFTSGDAVIAGVERYGRGLIHDTFLVTLQDQAGRFILQRFNKEVFADPRAIMRNLRLVNKHARQEAESGGGGAGAGWQVLYGLVSRTGEDFFIDADGTFWRALSFISGAVPLERISRLEDAMEAGRALGTFHVLVSNLDPAHLHETLPHFHNIVYYLQKYDALPGSQKGNSGPEKYCRETVEDRRSWAPVLENARRENLLQVRVIHGDPKINNIMVDRRTGRAVSIIDLDTVMPGLVQYDVGDCLRSCCNTRGEDDPDFSGVRFDPQRCEAALSGYTSAAHAFLTDTDFDYFFDAIRLIPFELGLRFYTDFLEGNVYFRVDSRDQNLDRAVVQFKLLESIEGQEERIRSIIAGCRSFPGRGKNR